MMFCLLVSLSSKSVNHTCSLSRFRLLISAIFFSSILNQRLSFLNLCPLQVGQFFNSINFSTHSRMCSVLFTLPNQRFNMGIIPSKAVVYGLSSGKFSKSTISSLIPSGLPYNTRFSAAGDNSLMGLSMLNLFFLAKVSTVLNICASLFSPNGTMPPSFIDFELSGIMASILTV